MAGREIKFSVDVGDLVTFDQANHASSASFKKMIRQAQLMSLLASTGLMIVLVGYMYYESKQADVFLVGGAIFVLHCAYVVWGLPKVILKRNSMFVKKNLKESNDGLIGEITLMVDGDRCVLNAPATIGEKVYPVSSLRILRHGENYIFIYLPLVAGQSPDDQAVVVVNFKKIMSGDLAGFLKALSPA